jgi:hypothetical protein
MAAEDSYSRVNLPVHVLMIIHRRFVIRTYNGCCLLVGRKDEIECGANKEKMCLPFLCLDVVDGIENYVRVKKQLVSCRHHRWRDVVSRFVDS